MGSDRHSWEGEDPRDSVIRACNEIMSAVVVVLTNTDYAGEQAKGEAKRALADVRQSANRIAAITRELQAQCAGVARRAPTAPEEDPA